MGNKQKHCWSASLKLEIGLKLRCCANVLAFCEASNGDSEDARRPSAKPIKTLTQTFEATYT
eukprot:1018819-Heterocapsa_arctica.AAC.1